MPELQLPDLSYLADAPDVARAIFFMDFMRYAIGAGGVYLVVNIWLARRLAGRKIRDDSPDWRQKAREIAISIRTILVFVGLSLGAWVLASHGLTQLYVDPAERGWAWFVVSVLILIIAHDAWFYFTHRLIHHPRLFRRFHRTHHKSHNPSPFTAYSFDVAEAAINGAFVPVMMVAIPLSLPAVFLFTAHMIIRNALGHSGYEVFPRNARGRPLLDWMTSVTHHDLHHAQAGYNFGLYFTWWDRIMGTEHPDYHARFAQAVRHWDEGDERPGKAHGWRAASRALIAILAILVLATSFDRSSSEAAQPPAESPFAEAEDIWVSEGYRAIFRLRRCEDRSDALCGDLLWLWDEAGARRPAIGAELLSGFVYRDGAWRDGALIHPEDGRTYRGELRVEGDLMRLEGCALIFCGEETWRRHASLPRAF